MKKITSAVLSVLMCASLAACSPAQSSAEQTATYSATAQGFGGDVTVTLTMSGEKITAVDIDAASETATVGGAAAETLAEQIMAAQSAEIDGVSGASVTSGAVKEACAKALKEALGLEDAAANLADGTYTASAWGFSKNYPLNVEVEIADNKMTSIKVTDNGETDIIMNTAVENMIPAMIEYQSVRVDATCGATTSSSAIKLAVEDCLAQALEAAGSEASAISAFYTVPEKSTASETIDTDVLVVGMGGAGIASYCAAADAGATVFGIEKTAKLGGQSATTTGPMVINAESAPFAGVEFAPADDVYSTWIDYVGTEEKSDIIKEAVYNSGKYLDYYIENFDFEFEGMILSFVRPEWSQFWTRFVGENGTKNIFGPNKTYQFNRAVEKAVAMNEKNGYQLELTAEELIMDADKTVKGVKAVSYDGTTYEIYGDSVILATGGYIGNAEMVAENLEAMPNTVAFTVNDGAGINMGIAAGGATYMLAVDPMIHILQIPNMIKNDDLTADQKAILSAMALASGNKNVTITGEELVPTGNDADIPGYKYYVVYSQEQIDEYKTNGLPENFATGGSHFMGQGGEIPVGTPVEDMDKILEVGMQYNDVTKADSIADLAAKLGMDADKLSATLGGADTTYYAVECMSYAYGTVGGLDVDVNMNVLKADGTPIANLYCVGQDSEGVENVEGKPYTPWGGQAQSWTYVSGYLAGTNAAANFKN